MFRQIHHCQIQLRLGNLIDSQTDSIVTAANTQLQGGGGVDGAVHSAAGPELLDELQTQYPQGCPTGQAVLTTAHALPYRCIIHAVGPIWRGGIGQEKERLAQAYFSALHLAKQANVESISFPSLSTGAYGMPLDIAAEIAIATVKGFLTRDQSLQIVEFVLWTESDYAAYSRALEAIVTSEPHA